MKKVCYLLFFLLSGHLLFSQVPSYVATSGLLAWYPFNNNVNNAWSATDNGVIYGGVTYGIDRFGNPLSCYVGNGASGVDIPVNDFVTGNGARSVASWYKMVLPAPTGNRELFATGDNSAVGARFGVNTDVTWVGWESVGIGVVDPLAIDSSWHHIVVTYPASGGGSGAIKLYYDGVLSVSTPVGGSIGVFNTVAGPIHCIGSLFMPVSYGSWLYSWIGSLDDIGVWGREITACEVSYLYYGGNATLKFANGDVDTVTVCENAVSFPVDSAVAVNDSDVGLTDTWSIYVMPLHGALAGSYSTTSTGSTMVPTGFTYTPVTGFVGLDSFKVIVRDCADSSDTIKVIVSVVAPPDPPLVSGSSQVCVGSTITLVASLAGGTWAATNASASVSAGMVAGVTAGTDSIIYDLSTSCGNTSVSKVVTVDPDPPAPVANSATYCQFAAYMPPAVTGSEILWYTTATGGTGSDFAPPVNTGDSGIYNFWASQTVAGCESPRTPITVTVISPWVTVDPMDTSVCVGQSFQFQVNGEAGQSYSWSPATALSSGSIMAPVVTPSVSIGYTVIATLLGGSVPCIATVHPVVNVTTILANAGSYPVVCFSTPLQLTATPAGPNYSYLWNGPDSFSSDLQNPVIQDAQLNAQGTYSVTVTDNVTGCIGQGATIVYITPAPASLTNVTENLTIPFGSSVQLNAYNALYYTWSPDNGTLSNPNINDPVATPAAPTTYVVKAIDINGCAASDSVIINLSYDSIYIPTAFTPNNDGLNDFFRVANLGFYKMVEMSVYNRWGELVYHAANNDNKGWDGTYNGRAQEMGVYDYQAIIEKPDGSRQYYKGGLTLVR